MSWNEAAVPLAAAAAASAAFAVLWWRQIFTKNATSVDAAWALTIGALGLVSAIVGQGSASQRLLAAGIAAIWSLRLAWHLLRHRVFGGTGRSRGEDGRYRAMREHWGATANRHFFWFYQLQAAVALLFAMPFWLVANSAAPSPAWAGLAPMQWAGLSLFGLAQLGEGIADRQLNAHRAAPGNRSLACRRGLWRCSRHPNYFFEWLSWCGIAVLTTPAAGWLAWLQPLLMFVLVRFVSGVPFTEAQALKNRGEDYRRYQQETNAFVPWWPRHGVEP